MKISKCARRVMAVAMATVMTCTGFSAGNVKKLEAASATPSVIVKGASLRLESNEDGKQSLRVAIEVSNADLASSCGMEIQYGTKNGTKTIEVTPENGYKNFYDVNQDTKKVIYTAVIENIPPEAFGTEFNVKGLIKKAGEENFEKEETATKKSVSGVVAAMGSSYSLIDGNVVKKVGSLNLSNVNDGKYAWESVVVDNGSSFEVMDNYKENKCLKISQGNAVDDNGKPVLDDEGNQVKTSGLAFKFAEKNAANRRFYVEAEACSTSGFNIISYTSQTKCDKADEFAKISAWIDGSTQYGYDALRLKPTTDSDDLYVKSYDVYEAVKEVDSLKMARDIDVNLSEVAEASGLTYDGEEQGIKFTAKRDNSGTKVKIYFDKDKSKITNFKDYKKAVVKYTCDTEGEDTCCGVMASNHVWNKPVATLTQYFKAQEEGTIEVPISADTQLNTCGADNIQYVEFGYNTHQRPNATPEVVYVIKSVKLIAN